MSRRAAGTPRPCGGCAWQHIAYPEQLRRKAAALDVLLRRSMGKAAPRILPTIGMPPGPDGMPWRFRQKAAFVFDAGPAGLAMGHFARGTNDVVAVAECPVHSERANRIAFALRDALVAAGVSGFGPAHVAASSATSSCAPRRTTAEAVAMLVAVRDDPALQAPLEALASGPEKPEGARAQPARPARVRTSWAASRERVAGTGHVKEQSLGPAFLVSPSSFFQTNVAAAATLVRLVTEALPGESNLRVLDLYSGSGLFALPLAVRGHRVTAVEESRKSVKDAELNRRLNKVAEERLKLVCSAVEKAVPHLEPGSFDAVILDPPREGSPPEVMRGVFERLKPARGILVSCDPEALARELPLAVAAGYRVLRVQPVDMFPHTPHVEAVAVLERRAGAEGRSARSTPRRPSSRSRTRGSRRPPARGRSRTA